MTFKRPGPLVQMTLGLVTMTISILMLADLLLGLTPNQDHQRQVVRQQLSESLAVQTAAHLQAGDRAAPWAEYRLMGRVGGLYVVLETADGLVLMDSRSAHERVIYERLLGGMEKGPVPAQGLLPPATVQVTPAQTAALRKHLDLLKKMGFGVAEFGADTFLVDSLPVWVAEVAPGPLLALTGPPG